MFKVEASRWNWEFEVEVSTLSLHLKLNAEGWSLTMNLEVKFEGQDIWSLRLKLDVEV